MSLPFLPNFLPTGPKAIVPGSCKSCGCPKKWSAMRCFICSAIGTDNDCACKCGKVAGYCDVCTYWPCGGCLAGQTNVLLAEGGCKLAREIEVGDRLLGSSDAGETNVQTVTAVKSAIQPGYRFVHELGAVECSSSHPLVTADHGEIVAQDINPEVHRLRAADGHPVPILSKVGIGLIEVFGWNCAPDHIYLAAGVLHHNKQIIDNN